jgi:hypothetical protein
MPVSNLYEAPRVKEIFRLKEIFRAFFLSELVGREQYEACVCIHGMIALFAWPRRAVNPRSRTVAPQARGVDGESACRAKIVVQWMPRGRLPPRVFRSGGPPIGHVPGDGVGRR